LFKKSQDPTAKKIRIDQYLVNQGFADTRSKAYALILAGKVRIKGQVVTKAGILVQQGTTSVEFEQEKNPYVSRGGLKLEAALEFFASHLCLGQITHPIAMDIGASTGGFTDCLLQKGFRKVFAIDVSYGQLDWKLRNDQRVVVHEKVNIRHMEFSLIGEPVDLITIDVSFISVLKFLEGLNPFLKPKAKILVLIKPQFEAERKEVGQGGVIRDQALIDQVVVRFIENAKECGFQCLDQFASPVHGAKGNREVFGLFGLL